MEGLKPKSHFEGGETIKPRIKLHIFRHNDKENDKTKTDHEIRLSPAGRKNAKSLASPSTILEQAMAFGSPRKRTQETAGLMMAGARPEITGEETHEELLGILNTGRAYGSKVAADERLNFEMPESGPYFEDSMAAYKSGNLLRWVIEESDAKYKEYGVEGKILSYSIQARQIAQIIQKYLGILPRWKELVQDQDKNYSDTLERFMGTHQTVSESFLAKVIELTRGVEERELFLQAVGNAGFGFSEGYDIDIEDNNGSKEIRISYKKPANGDKPEYVFESVITPEILEKIIAE